MPKNNDLHKAFNSKKMSSTIPSDYKGAMGLPFRTAPSNSIS